MTNLRNLEMLRFENWLWKHYNPAEVFEDWADRTTEAVFRLAIAAEVDPSEISLPLSNSIYNSICAFHDFFRTPVENRQDDVLHCDLFYPGPALTEDELRWVAIHIQSALIPAV